MKRARTSTDTGSPSVTSRTSGYLQAMLDRHGTDKVNLRALSKMGACESMLELANEAASEGHCTASMEIGSRMCHVDAIVKYMFMHSDAKLAWITTDSVARFSNKILVVSWCAHRRHTPADLTKFATRWEK